MQIARRFRTDATTTAAVVGIAALIALVAMLLTIVPKTASAHNVPGHIHNAPVASASTSEPLGKYIVVFKGSVEHPGNVANAQVAQHGGRMKGFFGTSFDGYAVTLPKNQVDELRSDPNVDYVERDRKFFPAIIPTGVQRIFGPANKELSIDEINNRNADVDVAVIDTGIDSKVTDLNVAGGVDCVTNGKSCVENGGIDEYGHGTSVAGVIGARDNGIGAVGIAPGARLWSVQALDSEGGFYWGSSLTRSVDWVTAHASAIEVANMSLSSDGSEIDEEEEAKSLKTAIDKSIEAGVVYVVAAGNHNQDVSTAWPASFPNVITVSAIADFDGIPNGDPKASFSNWGAGVDIAAPGTSIQTWLPGGGTTWGTGTSFATPHVAGAAAIIASRWGKNPNTKADVEAIRNTLVERGNYDWTDTSPDGIKEPLLDVSNEATFSLLEPPKNTALPVVSPTTPVQGTTVSTTTGTWINGSPTYSYQWQRCNAAGAECVNIVGATSSTYLPLKADREKTLRSKVTATNSGGQNSAISAATSKVVTVIGWEVTPTPLPGGAGSGGHLDGVSCPASTTVCIAVGGYLNSTWKPLAEHWNGSEWLPRSMPAPADSGNNWIMFKDVSCVSASFCEAAGYYKTNASATPRALLEIWNGTEWKLQTTPEPAGALNSTLEGISCTSAMACTAVGNYKSSAGVVSSFAVRWNGTEWKVQTTPNPTGAKETKANSVSCVSTVCIMAGVHVNSSGALVPFAEGWNGSEWKVQTVPVPAVAEFEEAGGVSCTTAIACTMVGWHASNATGKMAGFINRWNGLEWKSQTPAVPSGSNPIWQLTGVSCVTATVCTAAGPGPNANQQAQRWNGTEWTFQTTPGTVKGELTGGISCISTISCAAVGKEGLKQGFAEIYG